MPSKWVQPPSSGFTYSSGTDSLVVTTAYSYSSASFQLVSSGDWFEWTWNGNYGFRIQNSDGSKVFQIQDVYYVYDETGNALYTHSPNPGNGDVFRVRRNSSGYLELLINGTVKYTRAVAPGGDGKWYPRIFSLNSVGSTIPPPSTSFDSSDTTQPTVSLTAPANNAWVRGTVLLQATAADNVGLRGVQFRVNGDDYGAQITSAPYQINFDSTAYADGALALEAIAEDTSGNTTTSSARVIYVDNTAPSNVSGVSATANSSSQITVGFSAATDPGAGTGTGSGVASYDVQYATDSGFTSPTLVNTGSTALSKAITGLSPNTLYYFRVKAVDVAGNKSASWSSAVNATTQAGSSDSIPPSDVTGISAQALSSSSIRLNWAAADDNVLVKEYRLEYATNVNFTGATVIETGNALTTLDITGLTANTTYYFRLKAKDTATTPNYSNGWSSAAFATTNSLIAIQTTTLKDGRLGQYYQQNISFSGGTAPYTVSIVSGNLPTNTTISNEAIIFGQPTSANTFTFRVRITDAGGNYAEQTLSIAVQTAYERFLLQNEAQKGLTESWTLTEVDFEFGEGYSDGALLGADTGNRSWKFDFSALPQTLDVPVTANNLTLSRADYLWDFYVRKRQSREPFIIKSPINGQFYLARFANKTLGYGQFSARLYSSGIELIQARIPGVSVFDPTLIPNLQAWYPWEAIAGTNGASYTNWADSSGKNRHLSGTSSVINTNGEVAVGFNGSQKLVWTGTAYAAKHIFVVCKFNGATFPNDGTYKGIVSAGNSYPILYGQPNTTKFYPTGYTAAVYEKNGKSYAQNDQQAPMNQYGVVYLTSEQFSTISGFQVGADRNVSGHGWTGAAKEIIVCGDLTRSDQREITDYLLAKFLYGA